MKLTKFSVPLERDLWKMFQIYQQAKRNKRTKKSFKRKKNWNITVTDFIFIIKKITYQIEYKNEFM